MIRSSRFRSRLLLAAAVVSLAAVSACSDIATAPVGHRSGTSTQPSGDQPDGPCASGWVLLNGVWVCE